MPGMQRLAAGHLGINAASQPSGDDVDDLRTFIQMVYKYACDQATAKDYASPARAPPRQDTCVRAWLIHNRFVRPLESRS